MIAAWLLGGALCMATGDGAASAQAPDREAYHAAAAAAGRNADAHVDLALWCEARGMAAEKTRHLARAVLLDPENARARGLLGQVKRDGRWMRPADAVRAVEDSPAQSELMREYLERRAGARDKADDQYALALWCEEKGLAEPMTAHLRRTLQLDPGREGAWRRLGFKKVGKRWVDPEVEAATKAEREAQTKADRVWQPKLEKLRDALHGKVETRQAEARDELAAIADPRAVPAVWRTFAKGGDEARQRIAVDVLSRIDGPVASLALATLAVHAPHAAIRSDATSLLQRRDPREFADFLVSSLRDEVKYKVKPVEGPGGLGELLVEGQYANVRRLYRPMRGPTLAPGDQFGTDENGNLVADRTIGMFRGADLTWQQAAAVAAGQPSVAVMGGGGGVAVSQSRPDVAVAALERGGVPSTLSQTLVGRIEASQAATYNSFSAFQGENLVPVMTYRQSLQIPVGRMMREAQESALVARRQLATDVAGIEAHNAPIRQTNERAVAVLKAVSGEDLGGDRDKWTNWALDLQGYAIQPAKAATGTPATIVEDVPIAFQAQAVAIPTTTTGIGLRRHSCFAAGTMVRTLQGDRPIESIEAGDLVLSQDLTTGDFRYRAVAAPFHNPPNQTLRVRLGDDAVVATGIHRLWVADRGWTMARDLKPGDRLRTVGGSALVTAVEPDRVQPVFNLQLIDGDSFCVGGPGVVAHDNSLVEPVASPFDAVPELAAADKP